MATIFYNSSSSTATARVTTTIPYTTTALFTPLEASLFQNLMCFVNPSVAFTSLLLNILSVVVFYKSGLKKPTNVFLYALSLADIMSHGTALNFAKILRVFGPDRPFTFAKAWQYRYEISYVFYLCERLCSFFGEWGMYVQSSIPVLITFDRILAVFWPLHCRQWITFRSSCAIVLITYAFWLPWLLFLQCLYDFFYFVFFNTPVAMNGGNRLLEDNAYIIYILSTYVFENLSSWVPVSLVALGCVAIGVKVKMTLRKRQIMTTSSRSKKFSLKTTRALVSICIFFTLSHSAYSVLVYYYLDKISSTSSYMYLVYEYFRLILSINKGCNFLVFVVFNDKFRQCLINIFKR